MAPGRLLLALLVALAAACCAAIYEDQVGLWDWHQQYVGQVRHASFQTQGSGRKRVVVATDKSIIASLNLRTGEIFWRQALEQADPIDGLDIALGKYAVSLSRGGTLRAWHLPDGALIWETLLPASSSQTLASQLLLLPLDLNKDGVNDMVVLQGQTLHAVSILDGRVLWSASMAEWSFSGTSLNYDGKHLLVAGLAGSSLGVARVDATTGSSELLSTHEQASDLVMTGSWVLGLRDSGIVTAKVSGSQLAVLGETSFSELIPSAAAAKGAPQLLPTRLGAGTAVLLAGGSLYVVEVADSGLKVVADFQGPARLSDAISVGGTSSVGLVQQSGSRARVRVLDTAGWETIGEEVVELEVHRGFLQQLFLNAYTRTDRSLGYRLLAVAEDDSLSLLQQGKLVWAREEALGSVVDATTAELPLEKAGVSVAQVEHSLEEWLKGQILRLKSTLVLATPDELEALRKLRLSSGEKTKMSRDKNGFRKLIVVLTSSGKLFALHTGDGRIIWSLLVPSFKRSTGTRFTSLKVLPWRIPHHALDESPVVLVLGAAEGANGILSWVNMHTGKEEKTVQLPYRVKQAIPLPYWDKSEQRLHLLVDDHGKAHLLPASQESRAIFKQHVQDTFFYEVDKQLAQMEGFGLQEQPSVDDKDEHTFSSLRLWSVVFPPESEAIEVVSSGRQDEVVHTQAKVLSNRDVMYKYLNKNMLFVATVTPRGRKNVGGAANPEETWLVAYLIDAVTGQVLHRVSHAGAEGPVQAVLSENWVVYHYFNVRKHRFEMSVLEVYDKAAEVKDVLQLMLGRYNASVPLSSFSHRALEVKSQSYSFTSTVKTMTVTSTARGITGKQILAGTIGDQIIALDKRLLDPRRSINPTPAEREEGIIPLSEGLPIFPQSYVSHAARVEGLHGILTVPARLESTCLVFAYGTDLFYTRTAPSRTYDSLTEDFNYALLLITIAVLVVAIVVSWILSERKELRDKWR